MSAFVSIAVLALLTVLVGNAMATGAEKVEAKRSVDIFAAKLTLWISPLYALFSWMIWDAFGSMAGISTVCLASWMIWSRGRFLYKIAKSTSQGGDSNSNR